MGRCLWPLGASGDAVCAAEPSQVHMDGRCLSERAHADGAHEGAWVWDALRSACNKEKLPIEGLCCGSDGDTASEHGSHRDPVGQQKDGADKRRHEGEHRDGDGHRSHSLPGSQPEDRECGASMTSAARDGSWERRKL